MKCTIVIPCYNEASRFPKERFSAFVDAHPELRFLLVNDGSKDDTLGLLERVRQGREDRVGVVDQKVNGGKGEAVRAGILRALQEARTPAVGFWDADLATPLEAIPEFLLVLEERPELDMIFGARVKLLGRQIERQAIRHYLGRVFATVVSNLLRLPIYDTQCGAKIFRVGPETPRLFAEPFRSRWVFDVEIIARYIQACNYDLARVKRSIYEFSLREWRDIAGSKVRPKDFFRAFVDVVRIYLAYR